MTTDTFKNLMLRARIMWDISEGDDIDFWEGYRLGLNRLYYGPEWIHSQEHETLITLGADYPDLARRAKGEGYRSGFAAIDPIELYNRMRDDLSSKELAVKAGVVPSRIRQIASLIPAGRKTSAGWRFPESSISFVKSRPGRGRPKKEDNQTSGL